MTKFVNWWSAEAGPHVHHMTVDTQEFIGTTPADPSPMEPGVWLLPGHATWAKPPKTGEHEAAVYRDGKWAIVSDYRGEVRYHNGDFVQISSLGEPADAPMVVKDAEYLLTDGSADYDGGGLIRMWINDDVIEFRDDPELMARRVLAGWEAQGGAIRPVSYDAEAYKPVPEPLSDNMIEAANRAAQTAFQASVEALVDKHVQSLIESGNRLPREEQQP